jgi:hypothetical protein
MMSAICRYHLVTPPGQPSQMILLPLTEAGVVAPTEFCERHRLEYLVEPRVPIALCPRCQFEANEWNAATGPARGVMFGLFISLAMGIAILVGVGLVGRYRS